MNEALPKLYRVTFQSLPNATFSLELAAGQLPLDLPVGQTIDLFGPAHHLASHLVSPENKKETTTSDIYGQPFLISLESKRLQQSLVNRLQAQLGTVGSTLYKQTWKTKVTPLGWQYCQLVASGHRTKGTDCGLLPKVWPTPAARDWKDTGDLSKSMIRKDGKSRLDCVPRVAQMLGQNQKTSIAEMEKRAPSQLNPRFSLWLMGYPIEWAYCGERVTPLSRKSRPK
jgi:hypothetical protein